MQRKFLKEELCLAIGAQTISQGANWISPKGEL